MGDYTAPQGQAAHRDSGAASHDETRSAAGGGTRTSGPGSRDGSRAPQVPSPPGRQYDADAESGGSGASQYMLGSGGHGGQHSAGAKASHGAQGPTAGGGEGGGRGRAESLVNRQSSRRTDATGRLWEGTAGGAAQSDEAAAGAEAQSTREQPPEASQQAQQEAPQGPHLASVTGVAGQRNGRDAGAAAAGRNGQQAPGRRVGEIMRQKIQEEGWQLIVEGHRWGAAAWQAPDRPASWLGLIGLPCVAEQQGVAARCTDWPCFRAHEPEPCLLTDPSDCDKRCGLPPPLQPGRRRRRPGLPQAAPALPGAQVHRLQLPR